MNQPGWIGADLSRVRRTDHERKGHLLQCAVPPASESGALLEALPARAVDQR
jgi:hypothetical protein